MSNYKNVAAKVLKMVKSVGEIPRNGVNQRFSYKFVKETDVADKLRESCMQVGLVIIPSVHTVSCTTLKGEGGKGDQYRTSLMLKLTLVDPDSGESMDMDFPGEAIDSQDKATPKAVTSAYKYALLKLAMNGGGDGDDLEHDQHEERKDAKDTKQDAKPKPVDQGTTYRKPEGTGKDSGQPVSSNVEQSSQAKGSAQGTGERTPAQPADRPLSSKTAPAEQKPASGGEVVTLEDVGNITSVVPAMKGKPASISFKRKSDGGVFSIHFDAKKIDVPGLLKFLNGKIEVHVICDVTDGNPFLMSIQQAK